MTAIAAKSHADIDEWQTQMQVKSMRAGRVRLFSEGLSEADAAVTGTGIEMVPSVEAAIADSIERHGDGAVATPGAVLTARRRRSPTGSATDIA
jgi:lactate racemase